MKQKKAEQLHLLSLEAGGQVSPCYKVTALPESLCCTLHSPRAFALPCLPYGLLKEGLGFWGLWLDSFPLGFLVGSYWKRKEWLKGKEW
jgi:hypothetical protein